MIFVMDATIGQACESQVNNLVINFCLAWNAALRNISPGIQFMEFSVCCRILYLIIFLIINTSLSHFNLLFDLFLFELISLFRPKHSKTKLMLRQLL